MEIFLLISIIALLVLLLSSYKPIRNNPKNNNKTDLPPTSKQDTLANHSYSNVIYEGTGKLTQRIYRINVHFYPDEERCVLLFEGEAYHLKRYSIGSGYEYKNDKGVFRVKEGGATLVFPTGRIFQFKVVTLPDSPQ